MMMQLQETMLKLQTSKTYRRKRRQAINILKQELREVVDSKRIEKSFKIKPAGDVLTIFFDKAGLYVDSGRKPGKMPPLGVIEKWTKRRNIQFTGVSEKATNFLIARKIGRDGVQARPWISTALSRVSFLMGTELATEYAQHMINDIKPNIKK